MYQFRYNYVKPKYYKKTKLCHTYMKTDDIQEGVSEDVKTRFDN